MKGDWLEDPRPYCPKCKRKQRDRHAKVCEYCGGPVRMTESFRKETKMATEPTECIRVVAGEVIGPQTTHTSLWDRPFIVYYVKRDTGKILHAGSCKTLVGAQAQCKSCNERNPSHYYFAIYLGDLTVIYPMLEGKEKQE